MRPIKRVVVYHKWLPLHSSLYWHVFSYLFLAGKFGAQSKGKTSEAADVVRWSVRSFLFSILFLTFGFKLLNSLEILGGALLS